MHKTLFHYTGVRLPHTDESCSFMRRSPFCVQPNPSHGVWDEVITSSWCLESVIMQVKWSSKSAKWTTTHFLVESCPTLCTVRPGSLFLIGSCEHVSAKALSLLTRWSALASPIPRSFAAARRAGVHASELLSPEPAPARTNTGLDSNMTKLYIIRLTNSRSNVQITAEYRRRFDNGIIIDN